MFLSLVIMTRSVTPCFALAFLNTSNERISALGEASSVGIATAVKHYDAIANSENGKDHSC
jgi:hypothetical protein